MLSHLVTVCLALLSLGQCIQIHKRMTREEIRATFHTELDNVPEYEVVRIYHTLHKRAVNSNSPQRIKVNALNRRLSLYLEPSDGRLAGTTTLVYTVEKNTLSGSDGIRYELQDDVIRNIGRLYQNVFKRSAIIAYEGEDGETLVRGKLLEDLSVAPLPHRLHDIVMRETRHLEDSLPDGVEGKADFRRSHHHVVFKTSKPETSALNDCIKVVKQEGTSTKAIADDRSKRSVPSIVYPKILVIAHYGLFQAIGNSLEDAVRYILAFWNAVDLRFRLLEQPMIRLYISAIIISMEQIGTPYLENHRNLNKVDSHAALMDMSKYFYKLNKIPYLSYDITMAMTHFDMCLMQNGVCESSICGYSFVMGACQVYDYALMTQSVGLIEDNGGYAGVNTAAHELGHLMGVPHDGYAASIDCSATDGHIMSPTRAFAVNNFQWSQCSLKSLYDFLSSPKSSCLHSRPYNLDEALPRLLPGQIITADQQCEKLIPGSKFCEEFQLGVELHHLKAKLHAELELCMDVLVSKLRAVTISSRADVLDCIEPAWRNECTFAYNICVALSCEVPGTSRCRIQSAAAEGTSCGVNKFCINGYCVSKTATYVPTSENNEGRK